MGMMVHQRIKTAALKNQHPHRVHKRAVAGSDVNMQKCECRKATHKCGHAQELEIVKKKVRKTEHVSSHVSSLCRFPRAKRSNL